MFCTVLSVLAFSTLLLTGEKLFELTVTLATAGRPNGIAGMQWFTHSAQMAQVKKKKKYH